jgi:hypothetical protein
MVPLHGPVLGHLVRGLETPSTTSRLYWVAFILIDGNQVETLVLSRQFAVVRKPRFARSRVR